MDPEVVQALRRMVRANRQVIVAIGLLTAATLNATKAMNKLNQEVKSHGHWKEATSEEVDEVDEALATVVETYASQVN